MLAGTDPTESKYGIIPFIIIWLFCTFFSAFVFPLPSSPSSSAAALLFSSCALLAFHPANGIPFLCLPNRRQLCPLGETSANAGGGEMAKEWEGINTQQTGKEVDVSRMGPWCRGRRGADSRCWTAEWHVSGGCPLSFPFFDGLAVQWELQANIRPGPQLIGHRQLFLFWKLFSTFLHAPVPKLPPTVNGPGPDSSRDGKWVT